MTPTPEQVAPHMARFLDMLDAAIRRYGVPTTLNTTTPALQIAVLVADPDRSEAFYRDVLGLRKLVDLATCVFSFDSLGSVCLSTK
jgi:hypothetical protein